MPNYVIDTNIVMSTIISGKSQYYFVLFPGNKIQAYNMNRSYGTAKLGYSEEP